MSLIRTELQFSIQGSIFMSGIQTSLPRLHSALPVPAQLAIGQGPLTQVQQARLQAIHEYARAAHRASPVTFDDLHQLSEGFTDASLFDDATRPEFDKCVLDLIGAAIELEQNLPTEGRIETSEFRVHQGEHGLELCFMASAPLKLQPHLIGTMIGYLLQGSASALQLAASLVGALAIRDDAASGLHDLGARVVDAVRTTPLDSWQLRACLDALWPLRNSNVQAPLMARLVHVCLDLLERSLRHATGEASEFAAALVRLLGGKPFPPGSGLTERITGVLVREAHGAISKTISADGEQREGPSCMWIEVLLQYKGLADTAKQAVAGALVAGLRPDELATLFRGGDLPDQDGVALVYSLLVRVCRYIPEDSRAQWAEALFSAECSGVKLVDHLAPAVASIPSATSRERLTALLRERLVERSTAHFEDARLAVIRLALTLGPGNEDLLAAGLALDASEFAGKLNRPWEEEVALLSFHLDPDNELAKPGSVEKDVQNALNPEVIAGGVPFQYPKWLADLRAVLRAAHPAIAAERRQHLIAQHMPDVLAHLTDQYVGRVVEVADWPALNLALVAARPAEPVDLVYG